MLTTIISIMVAFLLGAIISWPVGKWFVKRSDKKILKKLKDEEVKIRAEIKLEEEVQKEVEDARKKRSEGAGEKDRDKERDRRKLIATKKSRADAGSDNNGDKDTSGGQEGIQVSENPTDGTSDSSSTRTEQDNGEDWPDFS